MDPWSSNHHFSSSKNIDLNSSSTLMHINVIFSFRIPFNLDSQEKGNIYTEQRNEQNNGDGEDVPDVGNRKPLRLDRRQYGKFIVKFSK